MRVRVLGCSGAIAQSCRTTSFLLDDNTLIDAGTGVGDLSLEEMARIDHVVLTHAHLDHIACLPLLIDAMASPRIASGAPPLQIHGLPETLQALQNHIFNGHIWPDFSRIPSAQNPLMQYRTLAVGQSLSVGGKTLEVLPAIHSVPAVGYAVTTPSGHWVFSGDTERNPAFWQRVNQIPVAQLIIETAFSNREKDLAVRSLHLSPSTLAHELAHINPQPHHPRYPIYITHTKPAETDRIMEEIAHLDTPSHDIRWLQAGMVFEL